MPIMNLLTIKAELSQQQNSNRTIIEDGEQPEAKNYAFVNNLMGLYNYFKENSLFSYILSLNPLSIFFLATILLIILLSISYNKNDSALLKKQIEESAEERRKRLVIYFLLSVFFIFLPGFLIFMYIYTDASLFSFFYCLVIPPIILTIFFRITGHKNHTLDIVKHVFSRKSCYSKDSTNGMLIRGLDDIKDGEFSSVEDQ